MNKRSAGTSKFGRSSARLHRAKATGSAESIKMSNLKYFEHNTDDFSYLSARREWYPSRIRLSNYEDPAAEQGRNRQSSTSTVIDIQQEKMADNGPCDQSGKTPKNKKNTITKLFNRMSLSKKQQDELNHPSTSNLEEQMSSRERSDATSSRNISYASIAQPDSSSEHYYAIPQKLAAASIDEPPDQSLLAKQHRLLRRLHSTLNEATTIIGEFLLLYKVDD